MSEPNHFLDKNGLTYFYNKLQLKINRRMMDTVYPVGSIYMSANNVSPQVFFGGIWEQIHDTFLLAAGTAHEAGSTGGAESVNYTPGGSVGGHTLTTNEMPSHKHTVGAHAHGLNSHKHSIGAHAHGLNNHTHSYTDYYANGTSGGPSNNTSGGPSNNTTSGTAITTAQMPSHTHNVIHQGFRNVDWERTGQTIQCASRTPLWEDPLETFGTAEAAGGGQAHTHTMQSHTHGLSSHTHGVTNTNTSRTSGGNTGNTANSTAFDSGAASGNTANSTAFDSGEQGGSGSHDHGFTGTQATINTMPPFMSVYMWKRIA